MTFSNSLMEFCNVNKSTDLRSVKENTQQHQRRKNLSADNILSSVLLTLYTAVPFAAVQTHRLSLQHTRCAKILDHMPRDIVLLCREKEFKRIYVLTTAIL